MPKVFNNQLLSWFSDYIQFLVFLILSHLKLQNKEIITFYLFFLRNILVIRKILSSL